MASQQQLTGQGQPPSDPVAIAIHRLNSTLASIDQELKGIRQALERANQIADEARKGK